MGLLDSLKDILSIHPKKGQKPEDCRPKDSDQERQQGETDPKVQKTEPAKVYDEFGEACWTIYGREIKMEMKKHSIMEGFMICNFNFNTGGDAKPVTTQSALPGASSLGGGSSGGMGGGGVPQGSEISPGVFYHGA